MNFDRYRTDFPGGGFTNFHQRAPHNPMDVLSSAMGSSLDASVMRPQNPAEREMARWLRADALEPKSQRRDITYQREMTVEDMLLENRVVFLAGPITPGSANLTIMRLLYLQSVQRERDINLYINSPGGYVDQTWAIYDTMQFLACDVATYCIGTAASGAAIVLIAGAAGKRYMLPHSKVMLHQPHGGVGGQAEDIARQAEEILKEKDDLLDVMVKHSKVDREKLREETERDRYLRAEEAKEWGLVDEVVTLAKDKDTKKSS